MERRKYSSWVVKKTDSKFDPLCLCSLNVVRKSIRGLFNLIFIRLNVYSRRHKGGQTPTLDSWLYDELLVLVTVWPPLVLTLFLFNLRCFERKVKFLPKKNWSVIEQSILRNWWKVSKNFQPSQSKTNPKNYTNNFLLSNLKETDGKTTLVNFSSFEMKFYNENLD